MAITKEKKQEIVQKAKTILDNALSVAFVNFKGLPVREANLLRKELRKEGVGYMVLKKSLLAKALEGRSFKGATPPLKGEVAIAHLPKGEAMQDPVAPARLIAGFGKTHEGKVSLQGGIFEEAYKGEEEMRAIAAIPSLPALRGMFVNLINSPIQRFAIALNQIAHQKP